VNLTQQLPDGRSVRLAAEVADRLSCGVLVAEPVEVGPAPALTAETEVCAAGLREQFAGRLPSEIGALLEARQLYRSVGVDPTRTRASSEALLRRVLKGQSLYVINNAVDACNLASLRFLLPIGLYDLDHVQGDVVLRLGREGEEYPGIRKGMVHLAGRLGLFDSSGPFGSPTSDSVRTSVSPATGRLLGVIFATAALAGDTMARNLDLLADLFVRHCAATITQLTCLGGKEQV